MNINNKQVRPHLTIDYKSLVQVGQQYLTSSPANAANTPLKPCKGPEIKLKQEAYDYIAAQFFQLGALMRNIQQDCPNGVLHARWSKTRDIDGEEHSVVVLYARSKPANVVEDFFDRLLHGKEQDLAEKVLSTLVNSVPVSAGSDSITHCIDDEPDDALPSTAQLAHETLQSYAAAPGQLNLLQYSASQFEAIADKIKLQKLHAAGIVSEAAGNLRQCIRKEQEFRQWEPTAADDVTADMDRSNLVLALDRYGFPGSRIEKFDFLVANIRNKRDIRQATLDESLAFCARWVRCYSREDQYGIDFRKLVAGSEKLRAWNVVAHYLAWRDHGYVREATRRCFTRGSAPLQTPSPFPFHQEYRTGKVADAPSAPVRIARRLRVQRGITLNDWQQAGTIMLTKSACLVQENNPHGLALKRIPETMKFPGSMEDVKFVPRKKKGGAIDNSRCLALAPEIQIGRLPGVKDGRLSDRQASEIAGAYFRIVDHAIRNKTRHLILVPCFDLGGEDSARSAAIREMLNTLALMENLPSDIGLTIAAGSAHDQALLEEELEKWKRARNAPDIDDLAF